MTRVRARSSSARAGTQLCRLLVGLVALSATGLFSPATPSAQSGAATIGQWSAVMPMPIEAVHLHLLPTGRVMFSPRYSDDVRLWNPANGDMTLAALPGFNIFCSGHSFLPDGRLLLTGGHIADNVGLRDASIYDPYTDQWTSVPPMNAGRWYPTNTTLANGDVLVLSGDVDTFIGRNQLPQVWETANGRWRDLVDAQLDVPMYPYAHVAPDGRVFVSGPNQGSRFLNTSGAGAWTEGPVSSVGYRDYGTSVMYEDGKILLAGGADPPTASAEVIDLRAGNPQWRPVPPMATVRRQQNATILADGKVLVNGGSSGAGFDDYSHPVFSTEIWDPATETFTPVANASRYRGYHSAALLLPDGRVLSIGGNNEPTAEIYSPPYLFKGTRPAITSAPDVVSYGQSFSVATPTASAITRVHLIKLSSVTHTVNMDQRLNKLAFSVSGSNLTVTAPANANLSPPGHYMLILVNGTGVPSVGKILRVGAASGTAPPAPAQLSAAAANGEVRLQWENAAGALGYKVYRSTTSGSFGAPLVTVPTTGYTDPSAANGTTYYYMVRATNAVGDSTNSNVVSARPDAGSPRAAATFVGSDWQSQGTWKGRYGSDGYNLASHATSYPSYAQVTVTDAQAFVWQASTADVRALQKPASATDRIASTFYSDGNFGFDVKFTDGKRHKLALYLLDWENNGRTQTVDLLDAFDGARLDSQTVGSFVNGVYLVWEVTGSVRIRVKQIYGQNGVVAGLFFDPPLANRPPATTLTAPAIGTTYTEPATINLTAAASDTDGTISKVEFFQGATKLGEDLTAPYTYSWTGVPDNTYNLTARATDNGGAATVSNPVWVTVYSTGNAPPTATLTAPATGSKYAPPATIELAATAADGDGTVSKVEFFQGTSKLGEDLTAPYTYTWANVAPGTYSVTARATDNVGTSTASAAASVTVNAPAVTAATFVTADATTQGSWPGRYGADGYHVVNAGSSYPAYAQVTTTDALSWSWADPTAEVRALRKSPTNPDRISSGWYNGSSFTIDVTVTDGRPHRLALYLLDWDSARAETIEIWNPVTLTRLDTRSASDFGAGRYLVWDISGRVQIRVRRDAGYNAVVAGLFFDPVPATNTPPTASLTAPAAGASFTAPATINLAATASDSNGTVSKVEFFQGTTKLGEDLSAPYTYGWTSVPAGTYSLTARATDNGGAVTTSSAVSVTVTGGGGGTVSAAFVTADSATQGNWPGKYGSDGYAVVNAGASYPAYAQVTTTDTQAWSWADPAPEARALRKSPTNAERIGATWYSPTSFTIDVNLTDGQAHRIALYLLDWDFIRAETIEVWNPVTNTRLDTQSASGFGNGRYLIWQVTGRVQFRVRRDAGHNAVVSGLFFDPAAAFNPAPTVSLTAPANGATFAAPATINLAATASDSNGTVSKVEFFQGTTKLGEDLSSPYTYSWTGAPAGAYSLTARATDNGSAVTTSSAVSVNVTGGPAVTATFVTTDATTQGSWPGKYGSDGYSVVNAGSSYPAYAQVTTTDALAWSWADPAPEVRALRKSPTTADRIGATWYNGASFTIDVNLTDGQPHQVALYLLDWDFVRGETIEVWNPATNTRLDTQSATNFGPGKYLVWRITGRVQFRVRRDAGHNAVVSGLFFDPPTGTTASAAPSALTSVITTAAANAAADTDTGRTADTLDERQVRARVTAGTFPYSHVVQVTTPR